MKHQTYIARQVWGWHQLDCEVFREVRLWVTFNYLLGSGRTGRESDIHFFTAGDFLESFISKMLSICEATAHTPPPSFPFRLSILSPVSSKLSLPQFWKPASWIHWPHPSSKKCRHFFLSLLSFIIALSRKAFFHHHRKTCLLIKDNLNNICKRQCCHSLGFNNNNIWSYSGLVISHSFVILNNKSFANVVLNFWSYQISNICPISKTCHRT